MLSPILTRESIFVSASREYRFVDRWEIPVRLRQYDSSIFTTPPVTF